MLSKTVLSILLIFLLSFSVIMIEKPEVKKNFIIYSATNEYLNTNMERTAIAFAISRGINALVSFLQDADFQLGLGISAQFSPGEFLDPLNDMVERFSWLMLLCFTIIGVEKVFFDIFQTVGFSLMALASFILLISIWWAKIRKSIIIALRLILLSLLLICWLPIQVAVGGAVYNYLGPDFEKAKTFIEQHDSENEIESSVLSGGIKDILDIKNKIQKIKGIAGEYYDNIMRSIIIFTVESILLPLITLFLGLKFASFIFRKDTKLSDFANYFYQKITS